MHLSNVRNTFYDFLFKYIIFFRDILYTHIEFSESMLVRRLKEGATHLSKTVVQSHCISNNTYVLLYYVQLKKRSRRLTFPYEMALLESHETNILSLTKAMYYLLTTSVYK